ncbi:hypothetical protein D9757_012203 [Collybiopsis confluens]|uniref:Uncharacterized protein n=1 Tax=Collybiopsis confluens TaxID=2823264 RepID=A0A8H5CXS0_9AGAR|nr:hypothetical protein D9757_012203 [Collybiopsis confluens]
MYDFPAVYTPENDPQFVVHVTRGPNGEEFEQPMFMEEYEVGSAPNSGDTVMGVSVPEEFLLSSRPSSRSSYSRSSSRSTTPNPLSPVSQHPRSRSSTPKLPYPSMSPNSPVSAATNSRRDRTVPSRSRSSTPQFRGLESVPHLPHAYMGKTPFMIPPEFEHLSPAKQLQELERMNSFPPSSSTTPHHVSNFQSAGEIWYELGVPKPQTSWSPRLERRDSLASTTSSTSSTSRSSSSRSSPPSYRGSPAPSPSSFYSPYSPDSPNPASPSSSGSRSRSRSPAPSPYLGAPSPATYARSPLSR